MQLRKANLKNPGHAWLVKKMKERWDLAWGLQCIEGRGEGEGGLSGDKGEPETSPRTILTVKEHVTMIPLHIPKTAIGMLSFFNMTDNVDLLAWATTSVKDREYPCPVGSLLQLDIANLGHAIEAGLTLDALAISSRIERLSWDDNVLNHHAELMTRMRAEFPHYKAATRPDLGPSVSGEE